MQLSRSINVSLLFIVVALISFIFADFSITTAEPFLELKRFLFSITDISFRNMDDLIPALLNTISIAVCAMVISVIIGFLLALFFENFFVRVTLAFTRAIHELFWALIFLQILV